jgi:hypothetical protein
LPSKRLFRAALYWLEGNIFICVLLVKAAYLKIFVIFPVILQLLQVYISCKCPKMFVTFITLNVPLSHIYISEVNRENDISLHLLTLATLGDATHNRADPICVDIKLDQCILIINDAKRDHS